VVKVTDTVVVSTNSSEAGQKTHAIAGLPLSIAIIYALLFFISFLFYSTLWPNAAIMKPDSSSYLKAAQDLSDFHIDQLQERAPGYPGFLLLTQSSRSPSRLLFFASLSLHFASIWLLGGVLYRFGLGRSFVILFGMILLLPPYVEYAGYVLSENLAEAMLVAGFASFVFWLLSKRIIWIFLSALTVAYAALTRPTYELLAVVMAGYILVTAPASQWTRLRWKEAVSASVLLIFGSLLVLGGYSYVNYRSVGYFGVAKPQLGQHLTQKTFRVLERLPDQYADVRETLIKARNFRVTNAERHTGDDYIYAAIPELTRITGLQKGELSEYLLRLNLVLIQKAPLEYLQEIVWAFGSYWFPSSEQLANMNSRFLQFVWAAVHFFLIGGFFLNLLLLVGAAIYIKMCVRSLPSDHQILPKLEAVQLSGFTYGMAGTIVIYTAAITCLVQFGDPRYRLPTDALIVFMLFLGTEILRRLVGIISTALINDPSTEAASRRDTLMAERLY
jgi:hypothetical protein